MNEWTPCSHPEYYLDCQICKECIHTLNRYIEDKINNVETVMTPIFVKEPDNNTIKIENRLCKTIECNTTDDYQKCKFKELDDARNCGQISNILVERKENCL